MMDRAAEQGDGVRRSLDEDSYTIRFTPRRPGSIWSNVNIAKVKAQPPGYRRHATHYVMSAKRPETRDRRLAFLIECSARGERLPQITSPKKR